MLINTGRYENVYIVVTYENTHKYVLLKKLILYVNFNVCARLMKICKYIYIYIYI